jgi:hypothetical protein
MQEDSLEFIKASGVSLLEVHQEVRRKRLNSQNVVCHVFPAAAFFSTYETMKKVLPMPENLAPVKHMIAASVAEVVRNHSTPCLEVPFTRSSSRLLDFRLRV